MCEQCDKERERLTELAAASPMPCIVCNDPNILGVGTWVPDKTRKLAAGAVDGSTPVFSFCLCSVHADVTPENEKLIQQAVLRSVRNGQGYKA